ncbi:uncharacterized protein LOC116245078 [Nymphaea colorata]|uniref:uncharacterized protein LOC116245078 n=1 Tax=Nymphaea colorata TaxID=210225 RepID=UPI00129EE06D|nr:uncharacterized protein LOC116245078 [Nymphaea colorata]
MDPNVRQLEEYCGDVDDEALSFSGMILHDDVEGEGPHSPKPWASPDFEFSRTSSCGPDADAAEWFPADLFFSNGHLLPHVFPLQPEHSLSCRKDSTASSSSRSSRQNSWTTASSASLEFPDGPALKKAPIVPSSTNTRVKKPTAATWKRSPCFVVPRWQFLFPAPSGTLSGRRRSVRKSDSVRPSSSERARRDENGILTWLVRKILRTFLTACRDCHSLQPALRDDCSVDGK